MILVLTYWRHVPTIPTIMRSGTEQLADWMRRRGFTQADAARYFGCHRSLLSLLLSGERTPGLASALTIERLTGIPVEAWSETPVDNLEPAMAADTAKRKRDK